jgi:hypothetical protein
MVSCNHEVLRRATISNESPSLRRKARKQVCPRAWNRDQWLSEFRADAAGAEEAPTAHGFEQTKQTDHNQRKARP